MAGEKSGNSPGRNLPTRKVINLRSNLVIINQSILNHLHVHFIHTELGEPQYDVFESWYGSSKGFLNLEVDLHMTIVQHKNLGMDLHMTLRILTRFEFMDVQCSYDNMKPNMVKWLLKC